MEKVKTCVACKHYRQQSVFGGCRRNVYKLVDRVSGDVEERGILDVTDERYAKWTIWWLFGERPCGKEGRYWEPKG